MKRVTCFLIAGLLCLSLVSCSSIKLADTSTPSPSGVSESYARAMKVLLDKVGIENMLVLQHNQLCFG
jgi:hypothetical protein